MSERLSRILTFYSYKGGTGRSMLLANVAWLLALKGKRVLVIDWDLEAPGLHRYFAPFLEDKELAFSDGLINFVDNYKTKAMTPPPAESDLSPTWFLPYADIGDYAVTLKWDFPPGGRLDFVPAGKQDGSYPELVNGFNWEDFYKRLGGSRFLDAAGDIMRRDYDYVLIDSRTGVSDTSGICTVKMPDALVVCFTLNYQSINGAGGVADYAYEQRVAPSSGDSAPGPGPDRAPFDIYPIPMRLEDAQTKKLERRREFARSRRFARYPLKIEGTREDYWAAVGVRYYTFYAYEEILAAFGEKQRDATSLLASVQRITSYLTEGKVDATLELPLPRREEILRAFEGDTHETTTAAVGANPDEVIARFRQDQQDAARRALLRLVSIGEGPRYELVSRRASLGDIDAADREALTLLSRSQLVTIEPGGEFAEITRDIALAEFSQLQKWAERDRDFLLWRQLIGRRTEAWKRPRQEGARDIYGQAQVSDDSLLLRDSDLSIATGWLRQRHGDLSAAEQEFITASIERERRSREKEASQRVEETVRDREQKAPAPSRRVPAAPALPGAAVVPGGPTADAIKEARALLRGKVARLAEIRQLAKKLKSNQEFTYARRLLARAIADPALDHDEALRLSTFQECALCTYKDPDLPVDHRLDAALELLQRAEDLNTTVNQETLGLVGAIHKRKWEVDGQVQHLERSLHFYLRGYRQGAENDQGYTGINAAFVLDLLSEQSLTDATSSAAAVPSEEPRRLEARKIRENITAVVAPLILRQETQWLAQAWWFYATIAEALFGLERYGEAVEWLERGRTAVGTVPVWGYQSTLQQLVRLALLRSKGVPASSLEYSEPWKALASFFGDHSAAVRTAFAGKVGLALSGGGFRAALYHIGVLAKLAELDVLRHVQVLSCVSGGAVVGAHYYLEVRRLLQSKRDADITREDYIDVVRRIERDFVRGVQRNVRMRVVAGLTTNLRMLFLPRYSRTVRVGELYERELFSRVDDGEGHNPRWLNEINVIPMGEEPTFAPKRDNWRRHAKVPVLILNATSLNTGHGWQFTTSWMGESPARIATAIDSNERLRRMYYWEAPERYRRVRLGDAVAASSCVPGLFEALNLPGLYPDRSVRLVDGGVCDNQGVSGLLEQDCTVTLMSDGSGQAEAEATPSNGVLGVPLRSNTILQARVRDAQYQELWARKRSGLLRGLMFVHLKEDLDADPVDWVGCPDPYDASTDARPAARRGVLTSYGIDKDVQARLSAIRTDLDSFADIEADALMTSGYRMTEQQFKHSPDLTAVSAAGEPEPWGFLGVERGMTVGGTLQDRLKGFLKVGRHVAFKVWRLSAALRASAAVLGLGVVGALGWAWTTHPSLVVVKEVRLGWLLSSVAAAGVAALAAQLVGARIVGALQWKESLYRMGVGIGMCLGGWLIARLHLLVFDPLYLRIGNAKRFQDKVGRDSLESS